MLSIFIGIKDFILGVVVITLSIVIASLFLNFIQPTTMPSKDNGLPLGIAKMCSQDKVLILGEDFHACINKELVDMPLRK